MIDKKWLWYIASTTIPAGFIATTVILKIKGNNEKDKKKKKRYLDWSRFFFKVSLFSIFLWIFIALDLHYGWNIGGIGWYFPMWY